MKWTETISWGERCVFSVQAEFKAAWSKNKGQLCWYRPAEAAKKNIQKTVYCLQMLMCAVVGLCFLKWVRKSSATLPNHNEQMRSTKGREHFPAVVFFFQQFPQRQSFEMSFNSDSSFKDIKSMTLISIHLCVPNNQTYYVVSSPSQERTKLFQLLLMLLLCPVSGWSQTEETASLIQQCKIMQLDSLKRQKWSPSSWDQSLTTTSCWVRVLGSFAATSSPWDACSIHYKALSDIILLCVCVWGLSAVNPLPMCSHHGSTCPIFLRALADKVTGLIDASPRSLPVRRFNTNLHFCGVREDSPCRDQRYRRGPLYTPPHLYMPQKRLCCPVSLASRLSFKSNRDSHWLRVQSHTPLFASTVDPNSVFIRIYCDPQRNLQCPLWAS